MNKKGNNNGLVKNSLFYIVVFLALVGIIYFVTGQGSSTQTASISSSQFVSQLQKNKVKSFVVQPTNGVYKITGKYRTAQKGSAQSGLFPASTSTTKVESFTTSVLQNDSTTAQITKAAQKENVKMDTKPEASNSFWVQLLITGLPLLIFIVFFYMMMSQAGQGGGGSKGVMNFGKSKVKPADKKANKVRFSDVAGEEEEKQELVEVVEFLKDPRKFVSLGARIPSGVLLEGPPVLVKHCWQKR